jgi:hypothetical protein
MPGKSRTVPTSRSLRSRFKEGTLSRRLVSLALLAAYLASCALRSGLIGSGTLTTRTFTLGGFKALEACCGMQVMLSGGDHSAVERAIRLTEDKYCSVYVTLKAAVEILSRYEILTEEPIANSAG